MKKTLITTLLSAVLMFSACSAQENMRSSHTEPTSASPITENTDPITTTAFTAASAPAATAADHFEPAKETSLQTEETAPQITAPPKKEFPGDIELPITYKSSENSKGKPCRSVIGESEYEDFPAKEDIEPAIKCAFEYYFSKGKVFHHNTDYEYEGIPCTIENLSFSSGLYLDFNGDGEKESLIVIENDSDQPFTGDSIVVYYRNESDNAVLDADKLDTGSNSKSHIYALIYDDCIDIMVEDFFGASGQASAVYSYNNGFKKEFTMGKGSVYPSDTFLCSYGWYDYLSSIPPTYYIRTDNLYSRVEPEETELDVLVEKIPEMRTFIEMIEDYYGEEVVSVKTEGYMNFFFFMKDSYVSAYIIDNTLYSNFRDDPIKYFD